MEVDGGMMPRPRKEIPIDDIKGLKTLVKEGMIQDDIAKYYSERGIKVEQKTISRRIQEMKEE